MKARRIFTALMAGALALALALPSIVGAAEVKVGLGLLFPIPLPVPIYQIEHEPSAVTVGFLFPIPVPLPVYDYEYYPEKKAKEPAPAAGREKQGYGLLITTVRPSSASVYLDGGYIGRADEFDTSETAVELEPGMHSVEFRAEGHEKYRADVEIKDGVTVDMRYELRPER